MPIITVAEIIRKRFSTEFMNFFFEDCATRESFSFEDFRDIWLYEFLAPQSKEVVWELLEETVDNFEQVKSLMITGNILVRFPDYYRVLKFAMKYAKSKDDFMWCWGNTYPDSKEEALALELLFLNSEKSHEVWN